MDNVEIKVVDTPVLELLFADGFYTVVVVERVPEFRDKEEVRAFDYAFFDGAGDALAGFLFIAIVWRESGCEYQKMAWTLREDKAGNLPQAPSKRR